MWLLLNFHSSFGRGAVSTVKNKHGNHCRLQKANEAVKNDAQLWVSARLRMSNCNDSLALREPYANEKKLRNDSGRDMSSIENLISIPITTARRPFLFKWNPSKTESSIKVVYCTAGATI